jgi:multicomponent Na+:H+ antiporter subunit G
MSVLTQLVVAALVAGGVGFTVIAAVGLVRLPDVYSRVHAASKSETLGAALTLAAAAVAVGPDPALAKLGLLLLFVFVTGSTAAHAIARAAYEEGHRPWERSHGTLPAGAGDAAVTDGGDSLAVGARDDVEGVR